MKSLGTSGRRLAGCPPCPRHAAIFIAPAQTGDSTFKGHCALCAQALYIAQVLCAVRCHCIFSGPGIRYSDIFCVPGISSGYSDIFWHILVLDTVTYFGGNHRSRVWKSLKLEKVYFLHTRTSWDNYIFNRIVFFKFLDWSELVRLRRKIYCTKYTLCIVEE